VSAPSSSVDGGVIRGWLDRRSGVWLRGQPESLSRHGVPSLVPGRAARHPAPGRPAGPSAGEAGGWLPVAREASGTSCPPGDALSRGRRRWACEPTPGAGPMRQGGHGGAHMVGGKDAREKWLCIFYTPANSGPQPNLSPPSCQLLAQITYPHTPAKQCGKAFLERGCERVKGAKAHTDHPAPPPPDDARHGPDLAEQPH
jgi:hypothetical protein